MRLMSSAIVAVAAIGLAGCVVEPSRPASPVVEYGRPAPSVGYDRRPIDRDHGFREHEEHERDRDLRRDDRDRDRAFRPY